MKGLPPNGEKYVTQTLRVCNQERFKFLATARSSWWCVERYDIVARTYELITYNRLSSVSSLDQIAASWAEKEDAAQLYFVRPMLAKEMHAYGVAGQ